MLSKKHITGQKYHGSITKKFSEENNRLQMA